MNKYFLVPQPPVTKHFNFLVDDISDKSNWGNTSDISKIEYNFNLLGEHFKIQTETYTALSTSGVTRVEPIGRFITIIAISKDEKQGSMTFFDFDVPADKTFLRQQLLKAYSENIVNQWFNVQEFLENNFTDTDDCVALLKPSES